LSLPSSVSDSPNPLTVVSQANGKMVRDSLSAKTAWPASSRPRLVRHQTRAKTVLSASIGLADLKPPPALLHAPTALPEPFSLLQHRRLATNVPSASISPPMVRRSATNVLSEPSHSRLACLASTLTPASIRPPLVRRSATTAKLTVEPALSLALLPRVLV